MMVATHEDDLDAARACGLQTAYVRRPHEYGASVIKPVGEIARFAVCATDFMDLADQLIR